MLVKLREKYNHKYHKEPGCIFSGLTDFRQALEVKGAQQTRNL